MIDSLIDEMVKGEWLMSLRHLYAYKHHLTSLNTPAVKERKAPEALMGFFTEGGQRLAPRNSSEIPEGSIAMIPVRGAMVKYWNWYWQSAEEVVSQLDWANNHPNIKAIILDIDGPGGSVSSIPLFLDFATRKRKPVIALMDNSLSLHRWIPDAVADYQIASNTISARCGSVGVVSSWLDVTKYYEDMGIFEKSVYPEESAHKNEIWRKMKEDEEAGKQLLADRHLRPTAIAFKAAVKAAHPNLLEEEGVLSGRTYGAEDALRIGFIDAIGNLDAAMQMANILTEVRTF